MRKLLILLPLALAATACHPQASTPSHPAPPAPEALAAKVAAHNATLVLPPPALLDTLTTFKLAHHDLSALLQTTHPFREGDPVQPMNGFFGADRYRMEVVLTRVRRDSQQAGRYLVRGLDRYKRRILPFVGSITFTKVQAVPPLPGSSADGWSYYAALGTYELQEDASQSGAGVFRGQVAVDIGIKPGKGLHNYAQSVSTPSLGGGILYTGTWASATGQTKPAVWVADILNYSGPQVFKNFVVGERDRDINPKYARLGWNSYWENEEWWSDTPHSVAQMQQQRPPAFVPPISQEEYDAMPTDTVVGN